MAKNFNRELLGKNSEMDKALGIKNQKPVAKKEVKPTVHTDYVAVWKAQRAEKEEIARKKRNTLDLSKIKW